MTPASQSHRSFGRLLSGRERVGTETGPSSRRVPSPHRFTVSGLFARPSPREGHAHLGRFLPRLAGAFVAPALFGGHQFTRDLAFAAKPQRDRSFRRQSRDTSLELSVPLAAIVQVAQPRALARRVVLPVVSLHVSRPRGRDPIDHKGLPRCGQSLPGNGQ